MSAVAEKVIAAFESLPADEKRAVAKEILRRFARLASGRTAPRQPPEHLPPALYEKELSAMAADPEIQRELREINVEFALAEADGLENA